MRISVTSLGLAALLCAPVPRAGADELDRLEGRLRDAEERASDLERAREERSRSKPLPTKAEGFFLRVEVTRFDLAGPHDAAAVRALVEKALRAPCAPPPREQQLEVLVDGHLKPDGALERVRTRPEGHSFDFDCLRKELEKGRVAAAPGPSAFEATVRLTMTPGAFGGGLGATLAAKKVLAGEQPRFERCRADALRAGDRVGPDVRVVVELAPSGHVSGPRVEPASRWADTTFERCVFEIVSRLAFEPFEGGEAAVVQFEPFRKTARRKP